MAQILYNTIEVIYNLINFQNPYNCRCTKDSCLLFNTLLVEPTSNHTIVVKGITGIFIINKRMNLRFFAFTKNLNKNNLTKNKILTRNISQKLHQSSYSEQGKEEFEHHRIQS